MSDSNITRHKKGTLNIYLPKTQLRALRALSGERGRSMNTLAREALEDILAADCRDRGITIEELASGAAKKKKAQPNQKIPAQPVEVSEVVRSGMDLALCMVNRDMGPDASAMDKQVEQDGVEVRAHRIAKKTHTIHTFHGGSRKMEEPGRTRLWVYHRYPKTGEKPPIEHMKGYRDVKSWLLAEIKEEIHGGKGITCREIVPGDMPVYVAAIAKNLISGLRNLVEALPAVAVPHSGPRSYGVYEPGPDMDSPETVIVV